MSLGFTRNSFSMEFYDNSVVDVQLSMLIKSAFLCDSSTEGHLFSLLSSLMAGQRSFVTIIKTKSAVQNANY